MNASGGSGGGWTGEDEEADKSRKDSEHRSTDEAESNGISEELQELDGVIPTIEEQDDQLASPGFEEEDGFPGIQGECLDRVLRTPSPVGSTGTSSIPDDTPSGRGSPVSLPMRGTPSPRGQFSRTASGAIKPFEKRFQSRFSVSPTSSSRAASPAFLTAHSRQSSLSIRIPSQNGDIAEPAQAPWEVIRWTKLRKITGQAFSEIGKRQHGTPTCMAVAASIVVGTSKGLILVFDYNQNLKGIIGQGSKAAESGAVTSLAISADHSTIVGGHITGNIFTWEIARPAKPFLSVPALTRSDREAETDGHVADRAVLHLGFLGTRHTALVSADDGGMAFSHLATRGLGSMGRSVKTTRLLGRYPSLNPEEDRNRKPSTVLAFSPLPLGNVEQATDDMGLTALLTPYLLVIVSTTPIAQTQHKASRPRDIAAHGAVSGCLAWFPAVRLKTPVNGKNVSEAKLVYCWSDVLTVLDVEVGAVDPKEKDKQANLSFQPRSRWKCEEAIVAVQWLSRSVIGVLTISQRLIILEDGVLHVMDSVDLLQKHIFHRDFFSKQLHTVVEQDETEADIHGVVADAFYMSLRAYKGRLFMMGFSDLSVGTLSNWADRLSALVEHGDDIEAIRLAVSYYRGSIGKVSVGLPEDDEARHVLVRERVLELLNASLRYRLSDSTLDEDRLHELTDECFDACLTMGETDYLLGEAYDFYDDGNEKEIFIDTLESFILEGEITALPPPLVKDVVEHYSSTNRETTLEEILCRIDAHTFDIEQVTRLCRKYLLYDALIYVWNQALSDWTTPLIDLCALIQDRNATNGTAGYDYHDKMDAAMKVFPYLAFSLTGRYYPSGETIDDIQADQVREDLYKFLFSADTIIWPPGTKTRIRTVDSSMHELAYPYLRLLLHFDTPNFMSMMNEAFEDPYLNPNQEQEYDDSSPVPSGGSTSHMTRQPIISILLQIMSEDDFDTDQVTYLDIFIARSLPKYPQFLILSGSTLQEILHRLCTSQNEDLTDERQLSVEYLLSVYHPSMTNSLVHLIHEAGFFRVLKSIYRSERRYSELIETFFEDPGDKFEVFSDISTCLRTFSGKAKQAITDLLCSHAADLLFIDLQQTVHMVQQLMPECIDDFVSSLEEPRFKYSFLQELLEPDLHGRARTELSAHPPQLIDQYIQLMCTLDSSHVADYVSTLDSGDLHLQQVLPSIEENGVVDAAILLLSKDGLAREAMDRLVKHVGSLQTAICNLMDAAPESDNIHGTAQAVKNVQTELEKYIKLGIWLCQGQSQIAAQEPSSPATSRRKPQEVTEEDLTPDESLWLNFVDTVVQVSKAITNTAVPLEDNPDLACKLDMLPSIRTLVQQVFTALLTSTSSPSKHTATTTAPLSHPRPSFIPIFRTFLQRAALTAPSLSDLRSVLTSIFAAYAHEQTLLSLASQLLDRDAFGEISAVHAARQQGWRPKAGTCEICKRRAWGQGVGEGVWDAWVDSEDDKAKKAKARREKRRGADEDLGGTGGSGGKGKGKGREEAVEEVEISQEEKAERKRLELVVFACKHVVHRHCLDEMGDAAKTQAGGYKCPSCREETTAAL